jgi:hypothetical protein
VPDRAEFFRPGNRAFDGEYTAVVVGDDQVERLWGAGVEHGPILVLIMKSVFRLVARRLGLSAGALLLDSATVSWTNQPAP